MIYFNCEIHGRIGTTNASRPILLNAQADHYCDQEAVNFGDLLQVVNDNRTIEEKYDKSLS